MTGSGFHEPADVRRRDLTDFFNPALDQVAVQKIKHWPHLDQLLTKRVLVGKVSRIAIGEGPFIVLFAEPPRGFRARPGEELRRSPWRRSS